ncbi:hypothetical protein BT96DRAFT_789855, partial [Gymnopus androsaceus JB14]
KIENHKRDLDGAVDNIESSRSNPIWPRKLWKPILRDEYIDLTEVLAVVLDYDAINNRVTWLQAWYTYKEAVCFVYGSRRRELQAYELHIQRLFNNFQPSVHPSIIKYDKAVCQLIGSRRDILLDEVSHPDVAEFRDRYIIPGGTHH